MMKLTLMSMNSSPWIIGLFTGIFVAIFYSIKNIFSKNTKKLPEDKNPYNLSKQDLDSFQKGDGSRDYYLAYLQMILQNDDLKFNNAKQRDFLKIYNIYRDKYGTDDNLEQKKNNYLELIES